MFYGYYDWYQIIKMTNYEGKKKYLYPGGRMTRAIMDYFQYKHIKIDGIIDKNKQLINGIETEQLESVNLDADTIVYITSQMLEKELTYELLAKGFCGKIETLFIKHFNNINISSDFFIKRMDLVLTSRCTLRCEKCANLMQYYEKPYDVDLNVIEKSMERLLEIVDGIGTVYVLGGEPFLYKELEKIIVFLKNSKKIQVIYIITNGTICPHSDELGLWQSLSDEKVVVRISDYGRLSVQKDRLLKECMNKNINCDIEENKIFYDTGNMKKRSRSVSELEKVFIDCDTQCKSLYKGELHFCPRSAHGVDLGLIEKRKEDYVDLLKECSLGMLKNELRNFLKRENYVAACDYCDIRTPGYYEKIYPAAIQSKTVIKVK